MFPLHLRPDDIYKETKRDRVNLPERNLLKAFGLAFGIMISLGPTAHAQQDEVISGGTASLIRPDNQAKQKEAFTGGTCVIETGAFPIGFNAYVVPDGDHPSYPPFCSPVPAGPMNLVLDILVSEVRKCRDGRLRKRRGGSTLGAVDAFSSIHIRKLGLPSMEPLGEV